MSRPNPTWRWVVPAFAVVCTLAVAFALPAFDNDPEVADNSPGFAPGEAAMRASIDPETGALVTGSQAARPTGAKALSPEMQTMMSRSSDGLVVEALPNGGKSVHLQGRFMSATVVRLDENGQAETLCTESADEAEAFLAQDAAKPATDANGWEAR